jgi:type IV secretory pathway VirB4 component
MKEKNIQYLIMASLRLNPKQKSRNVINTIHNILQPIIKKYPEKLKLVHQEGANDDEPCFLYEIKY